MVSVHVYVTWSVLQVVIIGVALSEPAICFEPSVVRENAMQCKCEECCVIIPNLIHCWSTFSVYNTATDQLSHCIKGCVVFIIEVVTSNNALKTLNIFQVLLV